MSNFFPIDTHQQSFQSNDEIALFELYKKIIKKKQIILIITCSFTLLAIIFVQFSPKTWYAEAWISPPKSYDIQKLNTTNSNTSKPSHSQRNTAIHTPNNVYNQFLHNFQSPKQKTTVSLFCFTPLIAIVLLIVE